MRKRFIFNAIVVITVAILLTVIIEFNLSEKAMPYMLLVIISFYYLGQYSEKYLKKINGKKTNFK